MIYTQPYLYQNAFVVPTGDSGYGPLPKVFTFFLAHPILEAFFSPTVLCIHNHSIATPIPNHRRNKSPTPFVGVQHMQLNNNIGLSLSCYCSAHDRHDWVLSVGFCCSASISPMMPFGRFNDTLYTPHSVVRYSGDIEWSHKNKPGTLGALRFSLASIQQLHPSSMYYHNHQPPGGGQVTVLICYTVNNHALLSISCRHAKHCGHSCVVRKMQLLFQTDIVDGCPKSTVWCKKYLTRRYT